MRLNYLNRVKANIQINTKKLSKALYEGTYRSVYKGKSTNFEDLREYVYGDNVKDIDWKSSARSRSLLIKQYVALKQHNFMFILDSNRKMLADSFESNVKKDISLLIAGTLGYIALKNGDSVGTIFSNKDGIDFHPFKSDYYNLEKTLAFYDSSVSEDNNSDIIKSIEYVKKYIRRNMIIFIISDLDGVDSIKEKYLRELSINNDVIIFNVSDSNYFGEEVFNYDKNVYVPSTFSRDKKLYNLELQKKKDIYRECIIKTSRNNISMITVNNTNEVVEKIIEVLEEHNNASRI